VKAGPRAQPADSFLFRSTGLADAFSAIQARAEELRKGKSSVTTTAGLAREVVAGASDDRDTS
jgi:hypothetical protein